MNWFSIVNCKSINRKFSLTPLARISLTPPHTKKQSVIPKRSEASQTSTSQTKIVIPTRILYLFYDICYLIF